jgi:hypothetical protein
MRVDFSVLIRIRREGSRGPKTFDYLRVHR